MAEISPPPERGRSAVAGRRVRVKTATLVIQLDPFIGVLNGGLRPPMPSPFRGGKNNMQSLWLVPVTFFFESIV
jgi:hypothetical protein